MKWPLLQALFLMLLLALLTQQRPVVAPEIAKQTGVGLYDTLAVLAQRQPMRIDTMPYSELLHRNIGWAPRDSKIIYLATWYPVIWVEVDTGRVGWTVRRRETHVLLTPEQIRGVAVHEYGHLLEYAKPDVFEHFRQLGKVVETKGFAADSVARWMQSEMFADAFVWAVLRRLPRATFEPYVFSRSFTTDSQRRFVEQWIEARWKEMPK